MEIVALPAHWVDRSGRLVLAVYVQPGAARAGVAGRHGDALKIRVSVPPEAGRANQAASRLLADLLGVPARAVELVSGPASRNKRFAVTGLTQPELAGRLAAMLG